MLSEDFLAGMCLVTIRSSSRRRGTLPLPSQPHGARRASPTQPRHRSTHSNRSDTFARSVRGFPLYGLGSKRYACPANELHDPRFATVSARASAWDVVERREGERGSTGRGDERPRTRGCLGGSNYRAKEQMYLKKEERTVHKSSLCLLPSCSLLHKLPSDTCVYLDSSSVRISVRCTCINAGWGWE